MIFNESFNYIKGNILDLKIICVNNGNDKEIPYYWYDIVLKVTKETIGKISIRIGHNYHSYYNGNVGYEIYEKYRGNNYALIASKMILEIARYHKMDYIYITCDFDNIASYRTIEKLGGILIEEVIPPRDYFGYFNGIAKHKIYALKL